MKNRFNQEYMSSSAQNVNKWTIELYQNRSKLTRYGRVLLSLALDRLKKSAEAKNLLSELLRDLERDDTKAEAFLPTSREHWWRWWQSDIETNAWLLRAIARIDPKNGDGP